MYFTVYKTINLKTSEYYIGVHKTNEPNDGYYGSGLRIIRSIKKYGKKNFRKDILHLYNNAKDAFLKETQILNECLNDKKCLNLATGGKGGSNFLGKKHTEETKKKLSQIARNRKTLSKESRQKIIDSNKRRTVSNETRKLLSKKASQRTLKEEERNKISSSLKQYYQNRKKEGHTPINVYERTKEHREKHSSIMKSVYVNKKLVWIKNINTNESFRIEINELQKYLEKGFIRGRILHTVAG